MYLIEWIIKKWLSKNTKELPVEFHQENNEEDLYSNCESHVYMPIDSTNDFLACKNCGHIMRNPKNKNNQAIYDNFDNF